MGGVFVNITLYNLNLEVISNHKNFFIYFSNLSLITNSKTISGNDFILNSFTTRCLDTK